MFVSLGVSALTRSPFKGPLEIAYRTHSRTSNWMCRVLIFQTAFHKRSLFLYPSLYDDYRFDGDFLRRLGKASRQIKLSHDKDKSYLAIGYIFQQQDNFRNWGQSKIGEPLRTCAQCPQLLRWAPLAGPNPGSTEQRSNWKKVRNFCLHNLLVHLKFFYKHFIYKH